MIHKCILSIDYGEKKIGLALKKRGVFKPEPITGLNNQGDVPLKILEICTRLEIETIIVGIPIDIEGRETTMSQKTRKFYSILRNSLPKKMDMQFFSERNSTQKAWLLYVQNKKKQKSWLHNKDSLAAMVILENYLTEFYAHA